MDGAFHQFFHGVTLQKLVSLPLNFYLPALMPEYPPHHALPEISLFPL